MKILKRILRIEEDILPELLPDIRDVITFGGLGAACYGIAQFSAPMAWIVGGTALFWLGVRRS